MKKSFKVILILLFAVVIAFVAFVTAGQRTGSFKLNQNAGCIEYYYFGKVKAFEAKVVKGNGSYGVKEGKVVLINGKSSGFIDAENKKYYVENGKIFSGLLDGRLYENGLFDSKANGIKKVDDREYCFKNGKLFTGIYNKIYYKNGREDGSKSGFSDVGGRKYLFFDGKLYSGLYDKTYYKEGLKDSSKTGVFNIDGKSLYFVDGRLFTGFKDNKYYLDGAFDAALNANVNFEGKTYYLEDGKKYSGFKNLIMYRDGIPDESINGFKIIGSTEYYFSKGIAGETPDSVPVKILLVGNSYTYYNGMGQMLSAFIKSSGKSSLVVRATKGGEPLRSLMKKDLSYAVFLDGKKIGSGKNKLDTIANKDFASQNRPGRWDFIVCQNNDGIEKIESNNIKFFNKYLPCVNKSENIVFNAVYYGGSPGRDRYKVISSAAQKCSCTVVDTSAYYSAYNSYFNRNWLSDLTEGDKPHHPASKGAYLTALCIYTKLYGSGKLAESAGDSSFLAVYNSNGGTSIEFAPDKYKKKKMTADYAMSINKKEAKALQAFVYKYAKDYLGDPVIAQNKEDMNNANTNKNN